MPRKPRGLTLETLEQRQLLAASIEFKGGVVIMEGTAAGDSAQVAYQGRNVVAEVNGVKKSFPAKQVTGIVFTGLDGNIGGH